MRPGSTFCRRRSPSIPSLSPSPSTFPEQPSRPPISSASLISSTTSVPLHHLNWTATPSGSPPKASSLLATGATARCRHGSAGYAPFARLSVSTPSPSRDLISTPPATCPYLILAPATTPDSRMAHQVVRRPSRADGIRECLSLVADEVDHAGRSLPPNH